GRDVLRPLRDVEGLLRRGTRPGLRARRGLLRVRGEAASPARPVERKDLPAGRRVAGQARGDRRGAPPAGFPAAGKRGKAIRCHARTATAEGSEIRTWISRAPVRGFSGL